MSQVDQHCTYRASCLCGAFAYEVDLPEIREIAECDCSFCVRSANLYISAQDAANFRVVRGSEEQLTSYSFEGNKIHKFCPTCATSMLSRMPNGPARLKLILNTRAMQGVDVNAIPRRFVYNAKVGTPYSPPTHKGSLPPRMEDGVLYYGSCHCGDVTVALSCKRLDGDSDERVVECHCSICVRIGYIWIFPRPEHVVLAGAVGRYVFPDGQTAKTFCRTCGVNMTNPQNRRPDDRALALSEHARQAYWGGEASHPVNARTLHGVDVKRLDRVVFNGHKGEASHM